MVPKLDFYQHGGDFAQKAEIVLGSEGCHPWDGIGNFTAVLSAGTAIEKGVKIKKEVIQVCRGPENSYEKILEEMEVV